MFLYKVNPPKLKFHQLCVLSSTIQWCYPKYWKSLCYFDSCLSMPIIIKIINFIESKIEFSKFCSYGTIIFNILDNTTELWMTKYIIGEIFSSCGATLYKNPSDQTVCYTGFFKISTQKSGYKFILQNMSRWSEQLTWGLTLTFGHDRSLTVCFYRNRI